MKFELLHDSREINVINAQWNGKTIWVEFTDETCPNANPLVKEGNLVSHDTFLWDLITKSGDVFGIVNGEDCYRLEGLLRGTELFSDLFGETQLIRNPNG